MKNSSFAFVTLCIAAPAVQLLERYGLFHWKNDVVFPLLLIGLFLLVVLFGWPILNVSHHKIRAIAGSLICAYCLWQAFQNAKVIY
jgi:hypothetical protein